MTTEVIYGVFVSSTYEDLREERAEVQKALLKLHCMPIGMELFGSADEETWEFIKRRIGACDYYVVIIADRYGSTASDGLSYTEKEYDYAKELHKPVLAFIHGNRGGIPRDKTETDPGARQRLETFIKKVGRSPVSYYNTAHELATQVTVSFVNERERHPAVGFIRADQVPDLKKYTELLELNYFLKSEIEALKTSTTTPLPNASETVILKAKVGRTQSNGAKNDPNEVERSTAATWGHLFVEIAEQILNIRNSYEQLESMMLTAITGSLDADQYSRFSGDMSFARITMRLYGWGLIEFDTVTYSPTSNTGTSLALDYTIRILKLTEYWQKQYGLLMP